MDWLTLRRVVTRADRRSEATARAVVDAAAALLAEGGPHAVTLAAVAERADVAVQTIYNRVGGRDAVLMAVAERALTANRSYLDAAHASTGTVAERLRRVAEAYVTFAIERPHEFRLLAFPPPDAPARREVVALVREQNGRLARLIREGVEDGTVAPGLDPEVAAIALWRMWDGVVSLAFRPDDLRVAPDDLFALLLTVGAVMERGLLARENEG
jgi:AcrR family transcriptional regulator